ncbi:hypothetical protein M9Y10_010909 [Tritrichomonas musculus]|uniref:Sel1 repeat protein n=1 Tax=Tritrichomonas musculus TaxID=1915356 RepID=A0ABR2IND2_9EUKA
MNLKKSADSGNIDAMFNYAERLFRGKDILIDIEEAEKYYKMAADKGKSEAQIRYGKIQKRKSDYVTAEKYFNMLSKKKPIESLYYLTKLKIYSISKKSDAKKMEIFNNFKKLADKGFTKAIYHYAICLKNGFVKQDKKEAEKLLKIAVDKGHPNAIYEYSQYFKGTPEEIKYIQKAAEKGCAMAMVTIEEIYEKEGNSTEAGKYYKMFADNGSIAGIRLYCEFIDKKLTFDPKIHLAYYEKAAQVGQPYYCYQYGLMKLHGRRNQKVDKKEAAYWFKKMADKNHKESMIEYCFMLTEGNGIPVDKEEAVKYFQKMVELEYYDKMASFKYACMLYYGDGVQKDFKKAAFLFEKSKILGNINAIYPLGLIYERGLAGEKDTEGAMELFKTGARSGQKECIAYLNKIGVDYSQPIPKKIKREETPEDLYNRAINISRFDEKESTRLIKLACDKGYVPAMRTYGSILLEEKNVPFDLQEGIKYLKMSADLGDIIAMKKLGDIYYKSNLVTKDIQKATQYYLLAIENGSYDPLHELSEIVEQGYNVVDIKTLLEYYRKGSQTISLLFGIKIGEIYYTGKGDIKQDKLKAAQWFKKAADYDEDLGCYLYAKMRYYGDGIKENKEEAAKYFQMMTDHEYYHKLGTTIFAKMLYFGESVKENIEKATFLFKKAADLNNFEAMYYYGKILYFDSDIPEKKEEGIKYLQKASDNHYSQARKLLSAISKLKTKSDKDDDDDSNDDNDSNEDDDSNDYNHNHIRRHVSPKETYIMPYDGGFTRNRRGSYKFDGTYLMPYDGGFTRNRRGSYKFDGTYLMPYDSGFTRNGRGSYKFDGTYLMPYDSGFTRNRRGSYKVENDCNYAFLVIAIIEN